MKNTLWFMPTNTERAEEKEESMKSLFSRIVLQPAELKFTEILTSGLRWTLFIGFWMLFLLWRRRPVERCCVRPDARTLFAFLSSANVPQSIWLVSVAEQCGGKHVVTPWREVCVCVCARWGWWGGFNLWNNNIAGTVRCFPIVCDWVTGSVLR